MKAAWVVLMGALALAQSPATMKQLMLDLIHPASNDILFFVNRGAPKTEAEWATVRRGALTLQESGNLLATPKRARRLGQRRKAARGRWSRGVQGRTGERLQCPGRAHRFAGRVLHHLSQTISAERVSA